MAGFMTYEEGVSKYITPLLSKNRGAEPDYYRVIIYLLFARRYNLLDMSIVDSANPHIYGSLFDVSKAVNIPSHREIIPRIVSFFSFYWGKSRESLGQFRAVVSSIAALEDAWLEDNYARLIDTLINQMVQSGGKGYAEFVQPEEVTKLMASISDYPGEGNIYNPYAGTGSFGIALNPVGEYIAQECSPDVWVIGVIRLLAHGVSAVSYLNSDSVHDWQAHSSFENTNMSLLTPDRRFSLIIATPPFKALLGSSRELRDYNYPYRYMDEDFINRGLDGLEQDGTLLGLFAPYVLYQGGPSESLRKRYVDLDLLDSVILLPGELFYSTSIQTVILKFKRRKSHPGKVKFVDGSSFYNEKFIRKVTDRGRTLKWQELLFEIDSSESRFVKMVSNETIKSNEYSLDVQSYFSTVENQDIPDGYAVIKLSELVTIVNGRRDTSFQGEGRVFSLSNINKEPFHWSLDVDQLDMSDLDGSYRKYDSPVIVMSRMKRSFRPTYIEASPENPFYATNSIFAVTVDTSRIEIPYLCFLLSQKAESISNLTISPTLIPKTVLDISLIVAPLDMQSGIYSAAEGEYLRSLVEKHGLEKLMEQQKVEFKNKLRGRKHDLRNSFRGLKGDFNAIKGYVLTHTDSNQNPLADAVLNPNTGATLVGKLNSILRTFDKISYFIEELDREETFGYPVPVNLIEKLQKLSDQNSTVYSSSFKWDKTILSELNEDGSAVEAFVSIAPEDLDKVLDNILQNAIAHGFTDSSRIDYRFDIELDYEKESNQFVIYFRNNGNPLPKGIDTMRYGLLHEKGSNSKGEGTGGFIVKSIVEHFEGSYRVDSIIDQDYTVCISIKLPRYDR